MSQHAETAPMMLVLPAQVSARTAHTFGGRKLPCCDGGSPGALYLTHTSTVCWMCGNVGVINGGGATIPQRRVLRGSML